MSDINELNTVKPAEIDTEGIFDYITKDTDMEELIVPTDKRGIIKDRQGKYEVKYTINHPCLVQANKDFRQRNGISMTVAPNSVQRRAFDEALTVYLKEHGLPYAKDGLPVGYGKNSQSQTGNKTKGSDFWGNFKKNKGEKR